ncbi:carbohydrate-binding protein [Dactylosporangium sp. AC04546]|uniref:fibronectin type III domain-containing protein n=1 Tax=Dactylosporangium sp. AC04546 TaxID=2862460 RepID=UPI001EDE43E6|nr:carbohydrate-binding protein [Dactylosporangium sp. AC04546]WVK81288.1 carbohydrate-binding protein [Dactylosporangium sp. AC04546]
MRTALRRRRLALATALCTVAASAVLALAPPGALAAPAGPPARPAAPGSPGPSLTDHPLTAAPSPLDNPLKGFARFYFPGDNQNLGYPRSLAWSYFGLSEVMTSATNCATYDWSIVDNALNEIASYGNQAAIRFYMEYPGGTGSHPGNAIPHCFDGHVTYRTNTFWGTTSPDYDSPYLLSAVTNFIAAFGARYDGDPRIGFINLGIVGLWGEWHTWPFDTDTADGYPNLMPTDAHGAQIIQAFDTAFNTTKLEIRYPDSAGGAANTRRIGYHDDSFCYREGSPLAGVTLPQSMGGASYSQLQRALNIGVENKWVTDSMGGEVRPEIQSSAFTAWPGGSGQVDNMKACIELEHTTWKINQTSQSYAASDANVAAAVRLMGYDLTATHAYFTDTASGSATVGVTVVNNGVAPFYYPWTMTLGLKNPAGTVVKTWDTPWDLRTVMPLKIRAFPDWGVGADPTYRDFGYPQYFQSSVSLAGVASGSYQLVLRVKNPLEALSPAAKKLRFGNATQNADGWLGLGAMSVGTGGGTDTTPPSAPTGLASPAKTASTVSLTWTASTDNVGVTGYRVLRGGTQVATTATTSYTDSGLTAATAYTYTVQAYDAAGNTSAASAPLTVTTSTQSTPGLVLDDFDGSPAYPSAAQNDLGKWTGGNCFLNGGGSGAVTGGALTLQYNNCGWFGSDVGTDLTGYTYLVVRIKGNAGGEQTHFNLGLGGTTKVFGDYTLDGGAHPVITTTYQEIRIPLTANGINRNSPAQLAMGFWYGGNSSITIDGFSFTN